MSQIYETSDGGTPTYVRVCHTHEWAGSLREDHTNAVLGATCPQCEAEREMAEGRVRYAALPGTLVRV